MLGILQSKCVDLCSLPSFSCAHVPMVLMTWPWMTSRTGNYQSEQHNHGQCSYFIKTSLTIQYRSSTIFHINQHSSINPGFTRIHNHPLAMPASIDVIGKISNHQTCHGDPSESVETAQLQLQNGLQVENAHSMSV